MLNQETKGKLNRFVLGTKPREAGPSSSLPTQTPQLFNDSYDDRHQVQLRYKEAANQLKEAIKIGKRQWDSLDFEDLSEEPEDFDDLQFKDKINAILTSRKASIKDKNGWSKLTYAIECVFTALSPFAKNFLIATRDAQSIPVLNPYGLICSGLFLLITIADKEIARKKEIAFSLDFLCQQLGELDLASILPDEIEKREVVINRAIDVRASCMQYLASQIRHDATPLGMLGRMTKTVFRGDELITDAATYLKSSIESYNNALHNIHLRIDIKTYELVKGMSDLNIKVGRDESLLTDNFVVPFERNPWFIGRKGLLEMLKKKLFDQGSQKFNHRIAIYGMGGIGKTQTALEYVYSNKDIYEKVYWITAVDQASLLSGYQKIAIKAGLKNLLNLRPVEITEGVLSWLRRENNWLLVIDNLDEISIVDGYLPQNGPHKHTIITTRNPNSSGIPAEGLEVPLLDPTDSVDLLCTLSNITIEQKSLENEQAHQIVQELGYLPLGIQQAAAYVKEVAGGFTSFIDDYFKYRKDVHQWITQGNRSYPHSVATTWSMSFNIVRSNDTRTAKLFQLLSFLNPDGILIDFLQSGVEALRNDIGPIVSSRIHLSKALIELEKFSLLKWNRQKKTIEIHRLVQAVIRDEMSEEERSLFFNTVINICDESFPRVWNDNTRPLCRNLFNQVLIPLLGIKPVQTEKLADVMARVGDFLEKDGNYDDSVKLLREIVEIRSALNGTDNPSTLKSMNNLAEAYRQQGKLTEAATMHEEVLAKYKMTLGNDHPDTLTSMNNLAESHMRQGKLEETAKIHEEVLAKRRIILGYNHPDTLKSMNNLAETYGRRGKLMEAEKMHEEVLAKYKTIFGHNHHSTLRCEDNLAETYRRQGKLTEAVKMHEEVLERRKGILGNDHPNTLKSMTNLAESYGWLGKLTEAAKMHEEVLKKRKLNLGDDHPATLKSMNSLAETYRWQGRLTEAAEILEEVFARRNVKLGHNHPSTLKSMNDLAETYRRQGKLIESANIHKEALAKHKDIFGDDHPSTLKSMNNLAETYQRQGKLEEAAKMHMEVLAKRKMILGDDHPDTFVSMKNLTDTYRQQGKLAEAAKINEEVLANSKTILGDNHPYTLKSMNSLPKTYMNCKEIE